MGRQDHPEWLINRLESLPDQANPAYEKAARRVWDLHDLAGEAEQDNEWKQSVAAAEKQLLRELVWSHQATLDADALKGIADDDTFSLDHRFNAYFVWQTALWRRYDHREFRNNVRNYSEVFAGLPMFDHQQAMALLSRSDRSSLQEALRHARDACGHMPSSPGVLNLLAEIVAEMGERHPDTIGEEDISEALDSIGRAIAINRRYGKYYANRARLLALEDRYHEAFRDIRTAIEIEPSSDSTIYAMRVARYDFIRSRIEDRQQQREWLDEQRKVRDEVRRTRSETMVMLGLLAAVVGFIVTGFDIATDYEPLDAAALIGVLAGSLLIVFTGFGELVRFSHSLKARTISVLAVGLALIAVSAAVIWRL